MHASIHRNITLPFMGLVKHEASRNTSRLIGGIINIWYFNVDEHT